MADELSEIQRALGRIEGAQAEIKSAVASVSEQVKALESRVRPLEVGASKAGALGGVLASVGVAMIVETAKRWTH